MKFFFQPWDEFSGGVIPQPLDADSVHVYYARLDPHSQQVPAMQALLSDDERQRAARFHFEKNRNEYILSRGSLRNFLAAYLKIPPRDIGFAYTSHGKPFLAHPEQAVTFNISHTDGLVAFAFAHNRLVGVDVEAVRNKIKTEEIAQRFFSMAERELLRQYGPAERHAAFYRCWTRKEAYIKALGEGLSHPLAQFDVALTESPVRTLLATRPDPQEADRWEIQPFAVPEGFAGAVAVALRESL